MGSGLGRVDIDHRGEPQPAHNTERTYSGQGRGCRRGCTQGRGDCSALLWIQVAAKEQADWVDPPDKTTTARKDVRCAGEPSGRSSIMPTRLGLGGTTVIAGPSAKTRDTE